MSQLRRMLRRLLVVVSLLCVGLVAAVSSAQTPMRLHGRVLDGSGQPVTGATIVVATPNWMVRTVTGAGGEFGVEYPRDAVGVTIRAEMRGMTAEATTVTAGSDMTLTLRPSTVQQQVTVTATRSSVDVADTANTVYGLGAEELKNYPAAVLDDTLRQHAGFELYRRASSRVANPTSEGISLRGLGSTAASRTLVLQDGVPMNDPFGGWIHWDEIPTEAVDAVTIASGGGSDLYGSSALGGVVDVAPARPSTRLVEADVSGGGQDTESEGARVDLGNSRWQQLTAVDALRTAGYVPTATPGLIDEPSNVHYQAGRVETDRIWSAAGTSPSRTFVMGNLLNEARGNGTELQNNATRLWRYVGGDDWNAAERASGRVRLFGSDEGYRQSFSSINAARTVETLTRLQRVRTQDLGAATDATLALRPLAVVAGIDARDIRATDAETPIASGAANGLVDTSARQRFVGGFMEALAARDSWSGALSLRVDSVANLSTQVLTLPSKIPQPVATPDRSELVVSPRLGISRNLAGGVVVHAAVFRAFRAPTMNELYRTGQVGQETTQANAQLLSERATGWEAGATFSSRGGAIAAGGTYFWTEINRPVSAVLVSQTATSILDKRQNLGQILSQGTELHLDVRPERALSATMGYQYARAVVTNFSAQPALVGNWIPQVPRQSFTAQLRAQRARIGELTLAMRASGHAFDDSANTYVLGSFFEMDVYARHDFGPHWTASVTIQNLLNQRQDVARTPVLTLGSPLLATGALAFHWGSNAH